MAHLGDEQAVIKRAGDVAEDPVHLLVRLEVITGIAEAHAPRLIDRGAGLDA